jgi:hypothetical protein
MNYTIYDPTTGQILATYNFSDNDQLTNILAGNNYVPGNYSEKDYYIENGQAIAKPQNPSDSINYYAFDYSTKSYVLDTKRTSNQARNLRDQLLADLDKINPIWFSSLTPEQQQELSSYRTALLNVPQQSGFPITIDWPTKPSWL